MVDEVDGIVAAWRQEMPNLDVTPMQILSRVSRLARHLDLARGQTFSDHGIEGWEFDVLTALRREGDPYRLSPGELVRQTLSTSPTMTNRIDRLAEKGLVRRVPNPDDGRSVLVELTGSGSDLVGAALADLLAAERHLLAGLRANERESLASALRRLLVPFER